MDADQEATSQSQLVQENQSLEGTSEEQTRNVSAQSRANLSRRPSQEFSVDFSQICGLLSALSIQDQSESHPAMAGRGSRNSQRGTQPEFPYTNTERDGPLAPTVQASRDLISTSEGSFGNVSPNKVKWSVSFADSPPVERKIVWLKSGFKLLGIEVTIPPLLHRQRFNECGYITIVNVFLYSKHGLPLLPKEPKESLLGQREQVIKFFNKIIGIRGDEAIALSDSHIARIISVWHFLKVNFLSNGKYDDISYADNLYSDIDEIKRYFCFWIFRSDLRKNACLPSWIKWIVHLLERVVFKAKEGEFHQFLQMLRNKFEEIRNKLEQIQMAALEEITIIARNFEAWLENFYELLKWFGGVCSAEDFKILVEQLGNNIYSDIDEIKWEFIYWIAWLDLRENEFLPSWIEWIVHLLERVVSKAKEGEFRQFLQMLRNKFEEIHKKLEQNEMAALEEITIIARNFEACLEKFYKLPKWFGGVYTAEDFEILVTQLSRQSYRSDFGDRRIYVVNTGSHWIAALVVCERRPQQGCTSKTFG